MHSKWTRRAAAAALGLALLPLFLPASARAAEEPAEVAASVFDVALLRPLSAMSTVAGLAPFAISAPFLAPTGRLGVSWDLFVAAPYDYTVHRELGDF